MTIRNEPVRSISTPLRWSHAVCLAALLSAVSAFAVEPSRLEATPVNGAMGWLLDGRPYVPIQAQAGQSGLCGVRDGRLWLTPAAQVRTAAPAGMGENWAVACTLTCDAPFHDDAGPYFTVVGRTAAGREKRYPIKLGLYGGELCGVMNWFGPGYAYVVRQPAGTELGESVRLRLVKTGPLLRLEANGALLGEWTDPEPLATVETISVAAYAASGTADDLAVETLAGEALLRETFDDTAAVAARFTGDLPPAGAPPAFSFFSAGIPIYTTWEWGPEMSTVWKENGSFDWWEVDAYLRKIAAMDPAHGRLHLRFHFGVPPEWWAAKHPDQLVQTLTAAPGAKPVPGHGGWRVASFASRAYWEACENAARDLGRFAKQHPEGWRLVAVTYSGGGCEFFPHFGTGHFSDYSPAFRDGFREWLNLRYGTDERLRAAWKNEKATLADADLPAPAERLRSDWCDFYDPAKGEQRIDFCRYYAEVTTGVITRLAKALKEGSDERLYTRPMAGYQPGGPEFRFHAGPHADFATVLNCPSIDGFFMPHDYRGRGVGGFTAFEIPVASVHLHGKNYIAEMDDATHLSSDWPSIRTETPWQTAQTAKRNIATALCYASGAEFKDWAKGWWEDTETMTVIRQMNRLAQESVHHDRTTISQIAVVINPRSTMYLRDESQLYQTLNHHQMHMVYPRIGAPHDRVLIDDLPRARDYKLYIIQDCLHLTDAQRRMLKEVVCRDGKVVLWLYAPGVVGDRGVNVEAVGDLVGMKLDVQYLARQYRLRLVDGTHPFTRGVVPREYLAEGALAPLFYVADPTVTELGRAWHDDIKTTRPAFALKKMPNWTSVYCSVPALPTAVIRNMAREAGVHVYADNDDFVAANNWLLTVCAASDGPRTIHLPAQATIVDALSGETVSRDATSFEADMRYGETRVWKLER